VSNLCQKTEYQPCPKKSSFATCDGPVFLLSQPKDTELIGYCKLTHLQTVELGKNSAAKMTFSLSWQRSFLDLIGSVRLKTVLRCGEESILCKGIMSFPAPIVKSFPKLKINNSEN